MNATKITLEKKRTPTFPIVGIGAAAGSLDAVIKIISSIPDDSSMAYIVQQTSSDHSINLAEILSQHTILPVHEIVSEINLNENQIYVMPENNNLVLQDGSLKLYLRNRSDKINKTIDTFFESLAEVYKSFAIGILLSGNGFDGTTGFKRIKELGGATIVLDPETAIFKGMPQNAIDAGVADYIELPENIADKTTQIAKIYTINHAYNDKDLTAEEDREEELFFKILNIVFLRTGNDFRHYKQPTIRRRIAHRMVICKKYSLEDYYNYLRNYTTEQDYLFNDLLIPVTYFFRDINVFDSLPTIVFSQLIQNTTDNTLRVWAAGCATGQEAYSLAISIHEYLLKKKRPDIRVQIFASDISEKSITKARTATYSAQEVEQVSESRIQNYFTKRDGQYNVNKVIRDMCIFAVHNLIKDPPFAKIDLVCCRNVLVYFDALMQNKILNSFHYALNEKGFLFLGKSETALNGHNLFEIAGKDEKIYTALDIPVRYRKLSKSAGSVLIDDIKLASQNNLSPQEDVIKAASNLLFSRYTPSSAIINKHLEVIHFHGDTSPFLQQSPGKPNFNILKMARDSIRFELHNAIIKVKNDKKGIQKQSIKVNEVPNPYLVSFEIQPIDNQTDHLLIVFNRKAIVENETELNEKDFSFNRIKELETELLQVRADIKLVTEDQQLALEELQTINEQLLSSSEELLAMNEELEALTKELQSKNGELTVFNDELLDRQLQLIAMGNYAESIINTISEPLLIIDKNFIIKSANPAFYNYFKTTENQTEGFDFFAIGNCQWDVPQLKDQILKMQDNELGIKKFRVETVCEHIGKKIIYVNACQILDSNPSGLTLLAMEDITEVAATNDLLESKNLELQKYNKLLQTFASAASNNMQDPLDKIRMFGTRLFESEKNLSEAGRHNLERILFTVNNMRQLIADLIHYSKISFLEKKYKKTDLNLILKKNINNLTKNKNQKKAVIITTQLPNLEAIPYQIEQLFNNIIDNSIKYTKEDIIPEIKIETKLPSVEEIKELGGNPEMDFVKICITDNGIGFDKQYESRIFDPFYRLHNNNQYSGSGLGLTLAKQIVDDHRGFIQASSKINSGTRINIYMPIHSVETTHLK
jgi:two-component system CheB/CheR fusion protein